MSLPDRVVVLDGAPNFRDLGGYRTVDGRRVRVGCVYRSGALAGLGPAALSIVTSLGLGRVIDLRSVAEIEDAPDPEIGAERVHLPVIEGAVDVEALTAAVDSGDLGAIPDGLLVAGTARIATEFPGQWATLLDHIGSASERPTLIHCTGGKDRTGWASALVLRALGVPTDVVMVDYLLSNECLAEGIAERSAMVRAIVAERHDVSEESVDLGGLPGLLGVRPAYLRAAFDAIDAAHGSFDAYLAQALGWPTERLDRLRNELLE